MNFDHRIDLLARIDRLEKLAITTVKEIKHTDPATEEYQTYCLRHKNCLYLIDMYKHRLEVLEHHTEESRVGLL